MKTSRIIGVMSGTSLDGVDLAYCIFEEDGIAYTYHLEACETIPYPDTWLNRLKTLPQATAVEYAETHSAYGKYIGRLVKDFIGYNQLTVDFVASHGHTIFHNPQNHYTSQIGEGAAIAAECGLPVVCDFRTGDVAAGGQGAPLVPIGDQLLFGNYEYCLNLGGFANISMQRNRQRIAFDVSPANIVLNHIAGLRGKSFDKDGAMAASGKIHDTLLLALNNLGYYHRKPPKSLGREWVEKEILPILSQYEISPEDVACTVCEHIAIQIALCTGNDSKKQMLITGGGAYNTFLIQRMAAHTSVRFIIPDNKTINFKEALVFALLGLLRMQSRPNCLSTVTGASRNVSSGAVYLP
jgi:anhydro-N-acetylmuramic acid kinase